MESQAVKPDQRILECLSNIPPREPFVSGGVAVVLQTFLDKISLIVGEKLGAVRVVVDEEVCADRDENGEESFEDEASLISR